MKHSYELVPNLFLTRSTEQPTKSIQILPSFGLIGSTSQRWEVFKSTISQLNASAEVGISYRVIFFGRHGEGIHNVAERLYGSEEWNRHLAKLTGDGNMTWGPDPQLTDVGVQQARNANRAWVSEIKYGMPLPESLYSSPLTRAMRTALITFDGIVINSAHYPETHKRPVVKEKLREMNGVHTCDKRRPLSYIREEFPQFEVERGFSEDDQLWSPDHRETEVELVARMQQALDDIFSQDLATYISITAHGGTCKAFTKVIGTSPFEPPVGGVRVFVLKVTAEGNE